MDFLSRDLTMVPEAIQQSKQLYLQGTEDSLRQAKELLTPFLYASLIIDDLDNLPTIAKVCDHSYWCYQCSEEYIYLEEFFFEFREENAPYIGAVASTCIYFTEEGYLSESGEPRDVPIDFLLKLHWPPISNLQLNKSGVHTTMTGIQYMKDGIPHIFQTTSHKSYYRESPIFLKIRNPKTIFRYPSKIFCSLLVKILYTQRGLLL